MAEEYTGTKFKTLFEGARFGYPDERRNITEELSKLKEKGLIHGIPGNISVKVAEGMVITPTGRDLAGVNEDDMVLVRGISEKAGIVRTVGRFQPSSESMMHWMIYEEFPSIGAIVHFHDDELLDKGEGLAETDRAYPYGTVELARAALKALKKSKFIILKGHGALVIGKNIDACHSTIEKVLKASA